MAGIISDALQQGQQTPDAGVAPSQVQLTNATAADNSATNPMSSTTAQPVPATASQGAYNPAQVGDPAKWTVDNNQTVSGQITQLIDQNSPLMEQARTNAKQAANQRGLVNSAMAVSAGESAAYQAALPIAQQDAETNARASSYNTEAQNQTNQFNVTAQNTALSQGSQQQSQADLQKELQQTELKFRQLELDNQLLLQTNAQAAELMNQATGVLNNILMNEKMDSRAKTAASAQIYANLQDQLRLLQSTSKLDLSTFLAENPYGTQATIDAEAARQRKKEKKKEEEEARKQQRFRPNSA